MKNFSSYVNDSENINVTNDDIMSKFMALAKKYEGASSDEMMNAILKEAEKSKKNGSLNNQEVEKFAKLISPFLNASQRSMLEKILEKIKD